MMNNDEIVEKLCKLQQLDFDASRAYEQALEKIDYAEVKDKITHFRDEHLQHVKDLKQQIHNLGGKPIEEKQDIKGLLIEGFTALRSITGIEGALKAMSTNEKITNKAYNEALEEEKDLPSDVRSLLLKNREDERRHLAYIEQVLLEEPWKAAA